MEGAQGVAGAALELYAAGTSGYGSAASSLLAGSATTASDGSFSLTSYSCSAGQQLYLVATGGNAGKGANANASLMTLLGDCSSLSASSTYTVNELTTVASVYALAQFMTSASAVGTSSGNAKGLINAVALAQALVNVSTGAAPGSTLPGTATAPVAKLDTLADVLAVCVATQGGVAGDGSACGTLFSLATPAGGTAPTDTLAAALNVAQHPATNVAALYATVGAGAPFTPKLSSAPPDWTLAMTYTGGGLNAPTALGVDSGGNLWAANYATSATKLSPLGQPAAAHGYTDASLYESYGIAIDAQDNAWITNEESSGSVNGGYGSVTKISSSGQVASGTGYTAGGIYYPLAIAISPSGGVWVADYGRAGATLLAADGTSNSGTAGFSSASLPYPVSVAVDASGAAWFAAQGSAVRVSASGVVTPYSCCHDEPSGIALDPAGNVWLTDYGPSTLVEMNANGTILQTISGAGGLAYPQSLAVDGAGNVWVTNFHANTISGFAASASGTASGALSPAAGFGGDAGLDEPAGVAIDAQGNVWVANSGGSSLTEFVGLAAPLKTPLIGLPAKP